MAQSWDPILKTWKFFESFLLKNSIHIERSHKAYVYCLLHICKLNIFLWQHPKPDTERHQLPEDPTGLSSSRYSLGILTSKAQARFAKLLTLYKYNYIKLYIYMEINVISMNRINGISMNRINGNRNRTEIWWNETTSKMHKAYILVHLVFFILCNLLWGSSMVMHAAIYSSLILISV